MNIVVFSTHPDDETLGCGGTLLKSKDNGEILYWIICTRIYEEFGYSRNFIAKRDKEINNVSMQYGFEKIFELDVPTTKLDSFPRDILVDKISKIFDDIKPNIVFLPHRGDVHSDHRIVFDAGYSCTKSFRHKSIKKILMMETLSETEFAPALEECSFIPNYYVDISKYLDEKIKIMKLYKSEIKRHPFPRSERNIKSLASFRGASAGCKAAESFVLLKEIA